MMSEIDIKINNQYYQSGIADFLQKNSPEAFIILIRQIIPKHRQMLECKEELLLKRNKIEDLEEKLTEAEIKVQNSSAKLRFWEKESSTTIKLGIIKLPKFNFWLIFNIVCDWLLKTGLTVVPILSLLGIAGIKLTNIFDSDKSAIIAYILFASISLVWLTSTAISSWIITNPNSENPKLYRFFKSVLANRDIGINSNSLTLLILFGVWLAEALVGFAIIPGLIDFQRTIANNEIINGKKLEMLTDIEKFEILLGVSIFAFINILFSVAKGRVYRFSTPRKQEYRSALAERDRLIQLIDKEEHKIGFLENDIKALEKEVINPNLFGESEYFNNAIRDLSLFSMQGKDIVNSFESIKNDIDYSSIDDEKESSKNDSLNE